MLWNVMSWGEMRCHEVRWDKGRWGEMLWGEMRGGEVRWGEVRWGEMRWDKMRWDEMRWDKKRWDKIRCYEVRWDEKLVVMSDQLGRIEVGWSEEKDVNGSTDIITLLSVTGYRLYTASFTITTTLISNNQVQGSSFIPRPRLIWTHPYDDY